MKKNNIVVKEGVGIRRRDSNLEACMYLELAYAGAYVYEGRVIEEIAQTLVRNYKESEKHNIVDVNQIMDWEWSKNRLRAKLIGTERNKSVLEKSPHRQFLDLSIVYYVIVDEEEGAFVQIRNEQLSYWDKTEEDLYYQAMQNIQTEEELIIEDLQDVLQHHDIEGKEARGKCIMCTNSNKIFGAIMITWERSLQKLKEKLGSDEFIVLPSSVHEVLAVPLNEKSEWKGLKEIVKDVNDTMVDQEEVLGDSLYLYKNGKLEIW